MSQAYWRGAAQDEAMQDEHGFVWKAMLDTIDTDLSGTRVLDVGCNRGGFLRVLVDHSRIGEGFGFDPASGAIEDARRLAGGRPLHYECGDAVPAGWGDFDVAFSHEVLYLLHDLPAHAQDVFAVLKPGASYYAVEGVHTNSPRMAEWHARSVEELHLPPLYDIDAVARTFSEAGFDVALARMSFDFIPASRHTSCGRTEHHDPIGQIDWLDYYYNHKLLLRFTRPAL
jgi:SAM-dependent methyltransferase